MVSPFLFIHLGVITHVQQPKKKKVKDSRVKSPTKVNTDHHNGNLKLWFSPSLILLVSCLQQCSIITQLFT